MVSLWDNLKVRGQSEGSAYLCYTTNFAWVTQEKKYFEINQTIRTLIIKVHAQFWLQTGFYSRKNWVNKTLINEHWVKFGNV